MVFIVDAAAFYCSTINKNQFLIYILIYIFICLNNIKYNIEYFQN